MTSSFPVPEKGNKLRLAEQGGWLPFPDLQGIHSLSLDSGHPSKLVELTFSRKFRISMKKGKVPQFPTGRLLPRLWSYSVVLPKKASKPQTRKSNRRCF